MTTHEDRPSSEAASQNPQTLEGLWRKRTTHLDLEGGTTEGDKILTCLLGEMIRSRTSFAYFLKSVCRGSSFGSEGAVVNLPARVTDIAYEDGRIETDYCVEVSRVEFDEDVLLITRMPMSRFLLHASISIVFHARFVDSELDAWEALEEMTKACSRQSQFEKLRPEVRKYMQSSRLRWSTVVDS